MTQIRRVHSYDSGNSSDESSEENFSNLGGTSFKPDSKPVKQIVIENSNVPWTTSHLPNGQPVPEPFQYQFRCRIYYNIFALYTCWSYFTMVSTFLAKMGALMLDRNGFECINEIGSVIDVLLLGFVMNGLFGTLLCFYVGFLHQTDAHVELDRVYLGRLPVVTMTSLNRIVYGIAYSMDAICVLLFPLQLLYFQIAIDHCPWGFQFFYKVMILLQCFVAFRIFIFCVLFKGLRRNFYRWLKRQWPDLLQTVESE